MRRDNPKDVGAMLLLGVFVVLILFTLQKCGVIPDNKTPPKQDTTQPAQARG